MALSVMVGSGAQLSSMIGITLVFALMGFFKSPSERGPLATVMMVCWAFFGGYVFGCGGYMHVFIYQLLDSIGGYFSSRVYVALDGTNRRRNVLLTAVLIPTSVHVLYVWGSD
jgi:transmembrane 9 superfamily member 2/4